MPAIRNAPSIRTVAVVAAAVALAVGTLVLSPTARAGTNHAVQISGFAFAPSVLTVSVGDNVTWTNLDPVIHTATSTTGAFDTGDLDQNEAFSVTFTTAGTYTYLCTPHPSMTGTVIVEPAPAAATAAPVATTAPGGAGLPNVATATPDAPPSQARILGLALLFAGVVLVGRRAARSGSA